MNRPIAIIAIIGLITGLGLATGSHAGSSVTPQSQMPAVYKEECGTCHMAYPPDFLSKPAWGRVMSALSHHYGTDASLDAGQVHEIGQWLNRKGGTYKRVVEASKDDRLTTAAWFVHKHREIPASTYQRAAIKSPANCAACHTRAAQGDFEDDFVRIPK